MGYRSTNTIIVTAGPVAVGPQAPENGVSAFGVALRGNAVKTVAQGGRTSVGLSGANAVTRRVAQTGTATLGLSGDSVQVISDLTGSFTHITLTRDYRLATGEAPTGLVYFTPSAWLVNNTVIVVPAAVPAALDSEGRIQIHLAANNDPGTVPVGSCYQVLEQIIGQPNRSYKVTVPYDDGLAIDLASLPVIP